jgi:hypothetical protein
LLKKASFKPLKKRKLPITEVKGSWRQDSPKNIKPYKFTNYQTMKGPSGKRASD